MLRRLSHVSPACLVGSANGICSEAIRSVATTSSPTAASSSSSPPTSIIIGSKHVGVKTPSDSRCRMSDIALGGGGGGGGGLGLVGGASHRISAGDVLGIMDLCAYNVARHHITGRRRFALNSGSPRPPTEGGATGGKGKVNGETDMVGCEGDPISVATIAVDHTPFVAPVMHGDSVICEGRMIHAGNSAVGVLIEVFRSRFPTRSLTKVCHSFFSMVAVDSSLKKVNGVVPALELSNPRDIALNKLYLEGIAMARLPLMDRLATLVKAEEKALAAAANSQSSLPLAQPQDALSAILFDPSTPVSAECPPNKLKRFKVPFEETRVEANRVFFPQFVNMNRTIFGGELMRWMEAHALQCGRMFTSNRDVRTLGMYNVVFNDAVFIQDWVSLNAHVVYVHRTTIEVEVEIEVERSDKRIVTNKASFVIASFDDGGVQMPIVTGLDLEGSSSSSSASSSPFPSGPHYYSYDDEVASALPSAEESADANSSLVNAERQRQWLQRYTDARARYEIGRLTRIQHTRVFRTFSDCGKK